MATNPSSKSRCSVGNPMSKRSVVGRSTQSLSCTMRRCFCKTPRAASWCRTSSPSSRGTTIHHARTTPRFHGSRLRIFGRRQNRRARFPRQSRACDRGGKENSLPAILTSRWGNSSSSVSDWMTRGASPFADSEARAADMVFAEFYTSALQGASIEAVGKLIDRQIRRLSRKEVEDGQVLLAAAAKGTVAFLVPGDPMSATTHVDLRLRAEAAKIRTRIVHGASILTAAAGALGLQAYKFGRTTTVPVPSAGFAPTSPLESILANPTAGLHTLVLIDLREDGTFLAPRDAIASLLRMASAIGTTEFGPHTLACVLSPVRSPDVRAFAGPIADLAGRDLGPPLHCLVIPGALHFLEQEALVAFAGAPHDL